MTEREARRRRKEEGKKKYIFFFDIDNSVLFTCMYYLYNLIEGPDGRTTNLSSLLLLPIDTLYE